MTETYKDIIIHTFTRAESDPRMKNLQESIYGLGKSGNIYRLVKAWIGDDPKMKKDFYAFQNWKYSWHLLTESPTL